MLSQIGQCQACRSLVSCGEYDWILVKITQAEQWRFQNAKREIKGVADYQAADPAFNQSVIEDRVSVIFWRLQKAWLDQNTEALISVAHPDYLQRFSETELGNYYFDHVELGLCEVSSVEFGKHYDHVYILLKWQADKKSFTGDNNHSRGYYAHHLTMVRKSGINSNIKKGLHSLHCYSCGAPQINSFQDRCEYCQSRFSRGELDWVLKDFSPHVSRLLKLQGKSFAIEHNQRPVNGIIFDPVSLLSALVMVLFADGKIAPKEQNLLEAFVKKRHIPQKVLNEVIEAGKNGELTMTAPDETLDASAWLLEMIKMCLIDGELSIDERALLLLFGAKFNIFAVDINLRIKQIRRELYQQAKQTQIGATDKE